jgi:hypothetical protein
MARRDRLTRAERVPLPTPSQPGTLVELEDLKRDPRTREIPVVVLTARPEPSARERAGRLG